MYECNNKISVDGSLLHGKFTDIGHCVMINYGPLRLENTAVLLRDTITPLTYSGPTYPGGDKVQLKFIGTRSFCQHCQVWHHG